MDDGCLLDLRQLLDRTDGGATYSISEPMAATGTFTFRVTLPAQNGRRPVSSAPFTVNVYRANVAVFRSITPDFITIRNIGSVPLDTAGWTLRNSAGTAATLPGRTVAPNGTLKIVTGSGSSTASVVYLGAGQMFANLHHDIKLFDGSYLVLRHQY